MKALNYQNYPFFYFLTNRILIPKSNVIKLVKQRTKQDLHYDIAADYLIENPQLFSKDEIKYTNLVELMCEDVDVFKDNVNAINEYIQKLDGFIKGSPYVDKRSCGTYIKVFTNYFIDNDGKLNFAKFISQYDKIEIFNSELINRSIMDLTNVPRTIVIRIGETANVFEPYEHKHFCNLLKESGMIISQNRPVHFDDCDVSIILDANHDVEDKSHEYY